MGIEKFGLPAKPAAKGSAWVLDASSCQACQTAFSLFNRKHHCRRCGGLFCGNCSNSKVNLRGQSDGPLRVCEPCKKLEEAARFQARIRGKASKGTAMGSGPEDDTVLKEILSDGSPSLLSSGNELMAGDSHVDNKEVSPSKGKAVELKESTSPEKLREQAMELKRVYATLKREGKHAEALQAFKRHKELGREADALELVLKKSAVSHRKSLAAAQAAADSPVQKYNTEVPESSKEHQGILEEKQSSSGVSSVKRSSQDGGDNDLLKALKDLGWNDADLVERKTKKGPVSDMDLLAELSDSLPKEATLTKPRPQNPTQLEILAHKRNALALKREGKPVEAKEELKKAKLLEKKLEEMALLEDEEEDEDDEDELKSLLQSLDKEAKAGNGKDWALPAAGSDIPLSFNFDDNDETNVDVTDDDVNDPSMIAALQAMGWVEESPAIERTRVPKRSDPEVVHIAAAAITDKSSLQSEILNHKRQALALKRDGNLAEAKERLQKAKVLEQKLEIAKSPQASSEKMRSKALGAGKGSNTQVLQLEDLLQDTDDVVEVDEDDMRDPDMMAALKAMGFEEDESPLETIVKPSPQEKRNLRDEILSIKKSALALKKQGKVVEAREELKHAKLLEQNLLKMQVSLEADGFPSSAIAAKMPQMKMKLSNPVSTPPGFVSEDDEEELPLSADDFMDPELIAALKSVGWQEEDTFVEDKRPKEDGPLSSSASPPTAFQPYKALKLPQKDHSRKLALQKDLLAHKRKALTLKREGKVEEAKVELKKGKLLEQEMEEIDNAALGSSGDLPKKSIPQSKESLPSLPVMIGDDFEDDHDVTDSDMQDPELLDALKAFGWKPEPNIASAASKTNFVLTPTVDSESDAPLMLETTKPPYKKDATEAAVDPIWYAIVNSTSKKHFEDSDIVTNNIGVESVGMKESFSANSRDHPILDNTSSGNTDVLTVPQQTQSFDLLSGEAWENPSKKVTERDYSNMTFKEAQQDLGKGKRIDDDSREKSEIQESKRRLENDPLAAKNNQTFAPEISASARPIDGNDTYLEAVSPSIVSHTQMASPIETTMARIQDEIKFHKRKALAFKREGKSVEAREELRHAKLLEKKLETSAQGLINDHGAPDIVSTSTQQDQTRDILSTAKPHSSPNAAQIHKDQLRQEVRQGKDRMKLQQESLAHKRKALGLRREGKTEEADAEFELAKSLEKQMEEIDTGSGKGSGLEASDMGMVEDFLDPQLTAALKGLGWNDRDLHGGSAPSVSTQKFNAFGGKNSADIQVSLPHSTDGLSPAVQEESAANRPGQQSQSIGRRGISSIAMASYSEEGRVNRPSQHGGLARESTGNSSKDEAKAERKQLEERIKREKIEALELKRGGRQREALEVFRGVKRLEAQLLSMTM